MVKRFAAIYLRAPQDRNGNPRRGWILFDREAPGEAGRFIDEGYRGRGALSAAMGCGIARVSEYLTELASVEITPGEYRARVRWA